MRKLIENERCISRCVFGRDKPPMFHALVNGTTIGVIGLIGIIIAVKLVLN